MFEDPLVDEDAEPDPGLRELTNRVIGAAIAVHRELGPGYDEETYKRALALEFLRRRVPFLKEVTYDVYYLGEKVGERRRDFLVEGELVLEIKATEALTPLFTSQVVSYLKATKKRLGLLINFNVKRLVDGIRRVAH